MAVLLPTSNDVHVNKMLSNVLIGYRNENYIADQIFPVVMSNKQTDIIPAINKDYFFRDDAKVIAEGEEAPTVGYEVTKSDTFYCLPQGSKHFISDNRRANEDAPFNSDREAAILMEEKLLMRRERSFVSDFWKTGVWTTDITGGTTTKKWSDFGSSDPITDVRTYKRTVRRLIARDPNKMVLGDLAFDVLCDHPDFLDRIKYTGTSTRPADVTLEAVAALFGLKQVLVGTSIYVTTEEGSAGPSYSANWDDDALLYYAPDSPSLWVPSAGYTIVWRPFEGMSDAMSYARKWRDDPKCGDFVESRCCYDQKSVVADAGAFFSDIVDAPDNT